MTTISSLVRWHDGTETRIQLDRAQRSGCACIVCAHPAGHEDRGPLIPVGRIDGVSLVAVHPTCGRSRKHTRDAHGIRRSTTSRIVGRRSR